MNVSDLLINGIEQFITHRSGFFDESAFFYKDAKDDCYIVSKAGKMRYYDKRALEAWLSVGSLSNEVGSHVKEISREEAIKRIDISLYEKEIAKNPNDKYFYFIKSNIRDSYIHIKRSTKHLEQSIKAINLFTEEASVLINEIKEDSIVTDEIKLYIKDAIEIADSLKNISSMINKNLEVKNEV